MQVNGDKKIVTHIFKIQTRKMNSNRYNENSHTEFGRNNNKDLRNRRGKRKCLKLEGQ